MLMELSDNEITDLRPIAELKRLQYIDVGSNKIKDLKPIENRKI